MKMFFISLTYNCIIIILLGLISGILGALIPAKCFKMHKKTSYDEFKFENGGRCYEKFKIRVWKDKVPQFSKIVNGGFSKDNIKSLDKKYLERFYLETIRAEFSHRLLIVISPLFYFINQSKTWGITIAVLYVLGNIPFIMIQRFNRPRIKKALFKRNKNEIC